MAARFGDDEAEGVPAEAVHLTIACRDPAVTHYHGQLMQGLRQGRPEVPHAVGVTQIGARIAMDDMVEVRKFERVAEEEDGRVVAHQIPVTLLGVEFKRKTANVLLGAAAPRSPATVERAPLSLFFTQLGKDLVPSNRR